MELNWMAVIAAAIVPTIVGFLWYNPKTLGSAWMRESGVTEDKMKNANMGLIFGLSFIFSILLSFFLNTIFVHQIALGSLAMGDAVANDTTTEVGKAFSLLTGHFANSYRTIGHGMAHGVMAGLFFVLPVLATNALFERKSGKYIAINVGYWTLTLALMGAILCAWT